MRTEPDVTRAVRSWLEDGADRLPERVLDSVLDAVPSTPQRRPWWPPRRSLFDMTSKMQIAAVAIAIIAVAFVGWRLLPAPSGVAGPTPVPSPSVTPSPATPSPSPSTIQVGLADTFALQPGTFRVADPFITPLTLTFASPWTADGARAEGIGFYRTEPAMFAPALLVDRVYRVFDDPCHPPAMTASPPESPATPPTGDELIAALRSMKGFEAGPVTDTSVGGHPARTFVLTNALTDEEAGQCTGSPLDLWDGAGRNVTNQRSIDHIWVVDVNGTPMTIDARFVPGLTPEALVAEVEAVVASIQFDQ